MLCCTDLQMLMKLDVLITYLRKKKKKKERYLSDSDRRIKIMTWSIVFLDGRLNVFYCYM